MCFGIYEEFVAVEELKWGAEMSQGDLCLI